MKTNNKPRAASVTLAQNDESPKEMMERLTREWNALSPFEQEIRRCVAAPTACEHEWLLMTEPHKECVKCGDVRLAHVAQQEPRNAKD